MSAKAGQRRTGPRAPRARTVDIRVGGIVEHGGDTWVIDRTIDLEKVVATKARDGRTDVLAIKDLKNPQPQDGSAPAEPPPTLDSLRSEDWETANTRFAAIKPLLDLRGRKRSDVLTRADEVGRDTATVYRWIKDYLACLDVTALAPRARGWPAGKHRFDDDKEKFIVAIVRNSYLSRKRPPVKKVISDVRAACRKENINPPSASTIRARIAAIPERERLEKRGFAKEAREKYQPKPGRFPNAGHPLACIQIDHTLADIIVVDETHREPIGRPWVTLAIDVFTRVVTGFHLSLDPPSEISVALCVAQSIVPKEELLLVREIKEKWPVWGFPDTIHVDNAKEFRTDNFKQSCRSHGIDVEFRPVRRPEYGGHIERLIGTCMTEVHSLPGTTHSSPDQKGSYDPEKHAVMTLREFENWVFGYVCGVYHCRPHAKIEVPPITKWEDSLLKPDGDWPAPGLPARPETPEHVLRDFLPRFERVVRNTGVEIDGVKYYGEALAPWINAPDPARPGQKRKLLFRRDPRDIRRVWFHDPEQDRYFELPTTDRRFPATDVWALREAKREMKRRGEDAVDQARLSETIAELDTQAEEASRRTKTARRRQQRGREHRRKMGEEAAEAAVRAGRTPPAEIDPFPKLPDDPSGEGFRKW